MKITEAERLRAQKAREAIGAGGEVSIEDRASIVRCAYYDILAAAVPPTDSYVLDVFEDYIIVAQGGKYFQVPYALDAAAVTFSEGSEVKLQYVTANEAIEVLGEPTGKKWRVRVIKEGLSGKNWIYPKTALESLLPFVNGTPVFAFEVSPGYYAHASDAELKKARESGKAIGSLSNPELVDAGGLAAIDADLEIAQEGWRARLLNWFKTNTGTRGLSIVAPTEVFSFKTAKESFIWAKRFVGLESVDLATVPGAGGGLLVATEAVAESEIMDVKKILALLLKCGRKDLVDGLGDNPTIEKAQEALDTALADGHRNGGPGLTAEAATELKTLIAQSQEALENTKKENSAMLLSRTLAESTLPAPVKKKIEAQFAGTIFAKEALDKAMTAEKEMMDALTQSGAVRNGGQEVHIEMGREAVERRQIALDKTLGVRVQGHDDIKPWTSFRKAYVEITEDSEINGRVSARIMKAHEAIVAADFPNLLGTSMNRRLLQDYAEVDYGERLIISPPYQTLDNFKTQEGERVGYFGDLADVDPETGDYVEVVKPGEEKVSGTPVQKGNILTITRKTIMNDDLRGITRRAQAWGRAARRTFARKVWNLFINNSTYTADSTAWFTSGGGSHGNLRTVALAAAELSTIVDNMAKFTEQGSGERLGLAQAAMMKLSLVVPQELRATAFKINQAQYLDAAFTPNDLYHVFGDNNERIFVNPLFTDATDFGVFRDPNDIDIVVVGFINGQVDPEIFIADNPVVGQMFVADKLQFKIRHEYMAYIGDFRGGHKSVVAG